MTKKHDTDTLTPTRFDAAPDAPTIRQDFAGNEAQTHQLDPRTYAPLRVCPECSLAWEITGEWCPSCGTAFEKARRESSTPTRVMSQTQIARRQRATEPPLTRSARRAQSAPPKRRAPATQAPPATSGSSFFKVLFSVLAIAGAMAVAFLAGQASRPSSAQVDQRIDEAVQTAKLSAANSYERAFDQMQAKAAAAIEAAREKGLAEGRANAQQQIEAQQQDSRSIFDSVTACVLKGEC